MFSIIMRSTELEQPCGACGEAGSNGEEPEVVVPEGDAPPVAMGGAKPAEAPEVCVWSRSLTCKQGVYF